MKRRIIYLVSIITSIMKKTAMLLTMIFLTSLMSGCTGNDSSTENDERIAELESNLSNITVNSEELIQDNSFLETALSDAQSTIYSMNLEYENLSSKIVILEWHKSNLTFSLSEAMELLNNSENSQLIISLEEDVNNLTNEIIDADTEIMALNLQIIEMQNQINQLTATVAALQSTLHSFT